MPTTSMYRVEGLMTGVPGSPYYMIGYFDALGGTADDAAQDWFDFLNPGASSIPTGAVLATSNIVDEVDPVTGNVTLSQSVSPNSVNGTSVGDFLPPATQGLMRWRTGAYLAGREIRGRTNLPKQAEGNNDPTGVPSIAWRVATDARASTLLSSPNSLHVVWSKVNGQWAPTVSGSAWSQWAVLRSRRD